MNSKVLVTPNFQREAKRLKKKYHSLKDDLKKLIESLEQDPMQGTMITEQVYKLRLAIKSKGRGKSGGARVITYLHIKENVDQPPTV